MQLSQKQLIGGSAIVAALIIGGAFYFQGVPTTPETQTANPLQAGSAVLGSGTVNPVRGRTQTQASATSNGVKEFSVTSRQFSFEPSVIRVKKGDTVRLRATSVDVNHGIAIPEFNVNVLAPVGSWQSTEFVANKVGAFDFYCSVFCGSGHANMRGQLIVE